MLTSLPEPPRPRPRLTDPAEPLDGPPYRKGAEVVTADGRSLPLVSAKLSGAARGGIARLVLEQRFENRHAETLHVTYRMPLPADGAVSGYAFVIADRTITGRVQRKQEARERFERAVAAGHTAALLEQERADIFTQSIGNLPAGQALIARITVDQRLTWLPEGEWELRFPTVIGPRYVAASDRPDDVRGTRVATAPGGVAARIQIAIAIRDELAAGGKPSSPSHALATGAGGATELRDVAGARLDRDLVLRWPVAGPTTGVSLAVTRPHGDDGYGLVTIVPPAPAARPRVLPRDLIVLIDTSGSMEGRPLDKARQVIALLIESLGDADRLELIEFSSEPRRYKPAPVAATRGEKQAAIRWLHGLSAGGGTEMRTAVVGALQRLRPGAQRQVVIATDGYIGGETGLVAALHAGLPASCRLHFLGIGSSVNRSLATAMARAGRGAEVICDLDADPERAARRLLDRTRSPVLTDVALDGSAVLARAPEAVPDVYAGSPVVAAVRLGAGELVVRGRTADGDWERRLRVGMPRPGDGDPAIAALFGRERVADLEARAFGGEDLDAEIERTGLAFQIATRFTPFIAVDETRAVRPAVRHDAVPQELPYGTTAAAFGLRPGSGDGVPDAMLGELSTARVARARVARVDEARLRAFQADAGDLEDGRRAPEPFDAGELEAKPGMPDADDDLDADFDVESSSLLMFGGVEQDEREIVAAPPQLLGGAPQVDARGAGGHAPASSGGGFERPPRPAEASPWVAGPAGPPIGPIQPTGQIQTEAGQPPRPAQEVPAPVSPASTSPAWPARIEQSQIMQSRAVRPAPSPEKSVLRKGRVELRVATSRDRIGDPAPTRDAPLRAGDEPRRLGARSMARGWWLALAVLLALLALLWWLVS